MSAEGNQLGIYIHWPYCTRLCPYCDFNIYRDRGGDDALVQAILDDIDGHADRLAARGAASVHFGGGTPSLLRPAAIARIIARIESRFGFERSAEIGLEANPDGLTNEKLAGFAAAGINRLSLGVQALDDAALAALGRTHTKEDALCAIGRALEAMPRVSVDLIYARPDQGALDWEMELLAAVKTGVRHISAYQLTIEPDTAFGKAAARGALKAPETDLAADLYETTQHVLDAARLPAYEISNHANSETDQSRHNLLYWRSQDWIGVGPGAHGRFPLDGVRHETEAARTPQDYIATVKAHGVGWAQRAPLSEDDQRSEGILMGLRVAEGLPLDRWRLPQDTLDTLLAERLARIENDRLMLTPSGRLVADRIGAELAG